MSSPTSPLLADLRADLSGLASDVGELVELHGRLARLEIEAAVGQIKRLAAIGGIAAVMALTGLPLLATCLAEALDGRLGIVRAQWLLIFGLSLLAAAAILGLGGWCWFRRRFKVLEEALEELREDLQWVKETVGKA
jgi:uncharacterized membrane protein YqjE